MTTTTKTTFPIIGTERGETIRRNAETGVEIRGTRMDNGKSEYTVYAPGRDKMRLINYYESLAGAREEAGDRAQEIRDLRDAAHSDAITENAERAIAEHCPELLAVDTDPEIAAEVAEYARKQFPSVAAMLDGSKGAPLAATADDLAEVSKRVAEIAAHLDACRVMGAPEAWRKDESNA